MPIWPFSRKPMAPSAAADVATAQSMAIHRWLDQLHWETRRRLDGLRQGQHPSPLRGAGLDLADLREYQAGDDVRHLDWASSARLQHPHVRVFHEDRDVSAWFVFDASASGQFGSAGRSVHQTAMGHAGILARLLLRQGNRVGATVHTAPTQMRVLPALGGKAQLWRLTHLLTTQAPPTPAASAPQLTALGELLNEAGGVIRQRSAVFVLSDFISQPGWGAALARLGQRHDVLAIHVVDPMQWQLPDAGLLPMRDPETGELLWVNTSDARLRARHAALVAQQDALRQAQFALAGVDVLEVSTTEDLPAAVLRQLQMRQPQRPVARRAAATLHPLAGGTA